jgi:ankyrin repeat protein
MGRVEATFYNKADADMKVVKQQGETRMTEALFQAAASNDVAAIRRLVEQGADPNCVSEHGHTPLHNACRTRKADAVRALLV